MERNSFIDVLKGILIIFVFASHSWIETSARQMFLFPLWIEMAVPAFMLISGYTAALSEQRRGAVTLEDSYEPMTILKKLVRFISPFTIAFVAEWIAFRVFGLYTIGVKEYGVFALLLDYLSGGKGQGSYYFPIMIQFVLLFPMVYFVIKKYDIKGLVGCFMATGFFEVVKLAYGMEDSEYRFLLFRYLFLVAAGCYIAIGNIKKSKMTIGLSVGCILCGVFFTVLFTYTDYNPKIFIYWRGTSLLASMFIVPILGWLIRKVHFGFKPLEVVGKASFNIFLVQMIYYNFADQTYALIPNVALHLFLSIVNCVAAGVLFYLLENKLTRFVISKMK